MRPPQANLGSVAPLPHWSGSAVTEFQRNDATAHCFLTRPATKPGTKQRVGRSLPTLAPHKRDWLSSAIAAVDSIWRFVHAARRGVAAQRRWELQSAKSRRPKAVPSAQSHCRPTPTTILLTINPRRGPHRAHVVVVELVACARHTGRQ